jgi:LysM repeat protein
MEEQVMSRHPRWPRWGLLCVALGALTAVPALGGRDGDAPSRPPLVVEVKFGDSLWTIARQHGGPDRDIRETVWQIRQANDVDAGRLQPGSEITVPAECLP